MSEWKNRALKAGLKTLYYSGAHHIFEPFTAGIGLIFMLHHVRPEEPSAFSPNRILSITPDFLEAVIETVKVADLDIISLDEAYERLTRDDTKRRFVCFTFDDGYWDNRDYAYPILKKYEAPFTVYVPSDFAEGRGELWWLALERIISQVEQLEIEFNDGRKFYNCGTVAEKNVVFDDIYWWLRSVDEKLQRDFIRALCEAHDFSLDALCRELVMSWEGLREFAKDPLVTIGGHTTGHYALAKLSRDEAHHEVVRGLSEIEAKLGIRPVHFSYPYGDESSAGRKDFELVKTLGLKTAVTTRKGVLYGEHKDYLTALPRVSLNGDFQSIDFISLYLSGAPFALWNGFQKVNAA